MREKERKEEKWRSEARKRDGQITNPSFTFGPVNTGSLVCESVHPEVLKSRRHSKLLCGSFQTSQVYGVHQEICHKQVHSQNFHSKQEFWTEQDFSVSTFCGESLQQLACFHPYHLTLQVFETILDTPHIQCFSLI